MTGFTGLRNIVVEGVDWLLEISSSKPMVPNSVRMRAWVDGRVPYELEDLACNALSGY